jgi:multicomponent Na+:H+ antiporter subunit F
MTVPDYITYVIIPIICLAFLIIFIRFLKGPQVVDRVIAIDLFITSGVGLIGVFCILYEDPSFLDAATILALIAFLSTIAFSYYIEQGDKTDKDE